MFEKTLGEILEVMVYVSMVFDGSYISTHAVPAMVVAYLLHSIPSHRHNSRPAASASAASVTFIRPASNADQNYARDALLDVIVAKTTIVCETSSIRLICATALCSLRSCYRSLSPTPADAQSLGLH